MVHEREIAQRLEKEGASSVDSIGWQLSSRLYQLKNGDAEYKVGNTSLPCGYEYMGPGVRCIITPLSERFRLTMSNALSLHMVGSAQGLAGGGKSEMTNDMAKLMRRNFLQINCSDQFDMNLLSKYLRFACS